jgi:hypothetical protein
MWGRLAGEREELMEDRERHELTVNDPATNIHEESAQPSRDHGRARSFSILSFTNAYDHILL